MAQPETPEHHYRYDPDKAEAYLATTLAWLGDVASEHYARHVVARFTQEAEAGRRPRRLAAAKIDLARAMFRTDRLDEACAVTQESMLSGRLAASNHWRALEVGPGYRSARPVRSIGPAGSVRADAAGWVTLTTAHQEDCVVTDGGWR
jgi:hypothetical protein